MSLVFLLPAGLAALAALLLPLLIHLARRSEQRPTEFAALRWLRQKPRPRHRIRFDEWPLLLVRLLLLALTALLLARPALLGDTRAQAHVAIAPGVDLAQARAAFGTTPAQWHWLAADFPAIETSAPESQASITSLVRELDARLPIDAPLTVFVPERIDGADGQRMALGRKVDWRVLPATRAASDAPATSTRAPSPSVRYAPGREPALRYLRAAHAAWQGDARATLDIAPSSQPLSPTTRSLVWLVPGPLPSVIAEWIRNGGTALVDAQAQVESASTATPLWRDDTGAVLVDGATFGRGRLMRLHRELSPQAMPQLLDASFPRHLRALFEAVPPPPSRAHAREHAPVTGGPTFTAPPRELASWLVLAIALVFLLERWMATGRRRTVAP
ncbi:BatA domain-containing protein [Lysobacter panacisoli]|uniref:BatA domain-containing protein n=1 Tax=Lysobacter panacisoli TaxID=1255263 RepID=A0ABP9LSW0_9GAMM|nr:BatA domain-containing protein [Lysobacter panacisoli]